MKFREVKLLLKRGVIENNPVLIQLLGMCPVLATTTSVKNALGMGMAAIAVFVCSNVLISLLRRIIPRQVRIVAYIVIISGFVTAIELLMKAYFYEIYESLGIFIPLLAVNCIIFARVEAFASKNPVLPSAVDGLAMGSGFALALLVVASVREILGSGSFYGYPLFGESFSPAVIFVLPAGAFLTLGFISAIVQKIKNRVEDKKNAEAAAAEAAHKAAASADALAGIDSEGVGGRGVSGESDCGEVRM